MYCVKCLLLIAGFVYAAGCRQPSPATRGKAVFDAQCVACHSAGRDRKRGSGLGGIFGWKALGNNQDMNEPNLRALIRKGAPGMPPFGNLSEPQMDDLIAYLKTL